MRPLDTSPDAWKAQIAILRRKGPQERLRMALRMSDEARAWQARLSLPTRPEGAPLPSK